MSAKAYLSISPDVKKALAAGRPVVALESTIITHGMPYPQNLEMALNVEAAVRRAGATPATVAIMDGQFRVGLAWRYAPLANRDHPLPDPRRGCPPVPGDRPAPP